MQPKKFLYAHFYFVLPDYFSGGFPDAMKEFSKYLEERFGNYENEDRDDSENSLWKSFMNNKDDFKTSLNYAIAEFDEKSNVYKDMLNKENDV